MIYTLARQYVSKEMIPEFSEKEFGLLQSANIARHRLTVEIFGIVLCAAIVMSNTNHSVPEGHFSQFFDACLIDELVRAVKQQENRLRDESVKR